MTTLQNLTANTNIFQQLNENFDAASPAGMYGKRAPGTSGLTWAYYGGRGFGNTIADGSVALTGSATNYIVASRSTGVVSVSTSITNWNDTTNYLRLYLVNTNASAVTSATDYRESYGGASSSGFTGGTLSSALNEAPVVTLASAATLNIGAAVANTISVSGTTTVTAFDSIASGAKRVLHFQGILTLTHNGTSLILPTGANIATAAGDVAEFLSLGSGNWRCVSYLRASGAALSGGGSFTGGTLTSALNEAPQVTLASAATVNIGAAAANSVSISGTTTITAFDSIASGAVRRLVFQGALTFTHNATSLILPGGGNITTAAGDVAWMESLGSGNWRCVGYHKANGQAVASSGGGSLTNWTEAVSSAAPNNIIPAVSFTATNAATNVDAVLAPKGTGSILANVPDSASTGGNKRGTRAVDLQLERSAAAQVASGTNAVIGGGRNNTSLQTYGVVAGGDGNSVNGAGSRSAVGGGGGNTASGSYSIIPGGLNCVASANYAHASGSTCTASADYSQAGGFTSTADGVGSRAFGQFATARGVRGADAFAPGRRTATGDVQRRSLVLFRTTNDGTTTALTADGSTPSTANQLNFPSALAFKVQGQVIGMRSDGSVAAWDVSFIAKRVGTTTSIVGTPTVTNVGSDGTATGYTLAIAADDTNDLVQINATGTAGHTVYWAAELTSVEVG